MDLDTREELRQELADVLRAQVAAHVLDPDQARAVYAAMFGVHECDAEFGPEVPRQHRGRHAMPQAVVVEAV